jgi:hypothetical protein
MRRKRGHKGKEHSGKQLGRSGHEILGQNRQTEKRRVQKWQAEKQQDALRGA